MAKPWAERWGAEDVWAEYEAIEKGRRAEIMAEDLRRIRQATSRRISTLEKNDSVSYAQYAFEREMKKNFMKVKPDFKKIEKNPLKYYNAIETALRIFHNFWGAKTSTVKGALAEQKEQGRRIYGVMEGENPITGAPARVMNYKESKLYWSLYDEFWNRHSDASRVYSGIVQFQLGEIYTQKDENGLTLMEKLLPSYDPDIGLDSLDVDVNELLQSLYSNYTTNPVVTGTPDITEPLFKLEAEK